MEVIRRFKKKYKLDLKVTCSKYMLFVLNCVYALLSVPIVSAAILTKIYFENFYVNFYNDMGEAFRMISTFWLVVGLIFMVVALFGIFVAFKETVVLANLYGLAMVLVFIFQIAVAIAGFTLISRSEKMVSDHFDTIFYWYPWQHNVDTDWMQSKLQCCGRDGPNDWQKPFSFYSNPSFYVTRYKDYNLTNSMPESCCIAYSNYVNLTCIEFHQKGCFNSVLQLVSKTIMIIFKSAIVISSIQIIGIVLGFTYARIIRNKKTKQNVLIRNSNDKYSAPPSYADYAKLDGQDEV